MNSVPIAAMQLKRRSALAVAAAAALAGCASPRPGSRLPDGSTVPIPAGQVAPELVPEQHWLEELFAGTPVSVGAGPEGTLKVEVPLKYSFDPGRKAVKPPLEAVLGKVAASLHRQKRARLLLAAPTPEQTELLKGQMQTRGIAAFRIGSLPQRADAVELRLLQPPPGVEKLEDPAPRKS